MVAIYQIINENVLAFELDAGDRAVWKGIQAEWRGASFIARSTSSEYPDIRRNQPIPKSYRGAFVNAAREAKSLPRLNFDGAGNLRPGAAATTTPTTTSAASAKPPLEMDDLSTGQKRGLARTGRINFGGHTYTRAEINAFTQAAAARRAQSARDIKATMFEPTTKDHVRQNRSFLQRATVQTMRGILPGFGLSVGVQAGAWLALRGYLLDLNETLYRDINREGISDAEINQLMAQYTILSQRLLGLWFATTVAPELLRLVIKGAPHVARPFKTIVRTYNWASIGIQQGVSAFTGPGFLLMLGKNALQWAAVEAGLAAFTFVLASSSWAQEFVLDVIKEEWVAWVADQGWKRSNQINAGLESAWNYTAASILGQDSASEAKEVDLLKRLALDDPSLAKGLLQDHEDLVDELPGQLQDAVRGVFDDPTDATDNNDDTAPETEKGSSEDNPFFD